MREVDKLYEITADYRYNNDKPPRYYVVASSPAEAKKIFSGKISWLKIFGCRRVKDKEKILEILSNQEKHIILTGD